MRVLIVEDDVAIGVMIARIVQGLGHTSLVVGDAERGWQCCQTEYFPLILVDCTLPGMDGNAFCRLVRASEEDERIPSVIVAVTGRASLVDVSTALIAGVDDYLTKPFTAVQLAARISIAERRHQVEEAHVTRLHLERLAVEQAHLDGAIKTARTIVHELGNALASVMVLGGVLVESTEGETQRHSASLVRASMKAADILERLRHIARYEEYDFAGETMLDLREAVRLGQVTGTPQSDN